MELTSPLLEILAFIVFFVLLGASLFMLYQFYLCDSNSCKAFIDASESGPTGSKAYVLNLLENTFSDGIWAIPYIGAAILAPLSLWFLRVPITVLNFAILFFVSFATIYFLFAFFGHHYIIPITDYVSDWIENRCPAVASTVDPNNNLEEQEEEDMGICPQTEQSSVRVKTQTEQSSFRMKTQNSNNAKSQTNFEDNINNRSYLNFDSIPREFNITFATPVDIYS